MSGYANDFAVWHTLQLRVDRKIHRKNRLRTGRSVQRVEAIWPRHGASIHECPTSVNGHWWNQNQNGRALGVLDSLRVREAMKTITTYMGNVAGRQLDTVDASAKDSIPVKDADEQQLRRWMESQAPS